MEEAAGRTYSVTGLWRYPVKSMAGEELPAVHVSERGLDGDRAYALVDNTTGKVGSAKNATRFGPLLTWRAHFVSDPGKGSTPAVRMTLPDGSRLNSDQPDIDDVLARIFGPGVSLVSRAPEGLRLEFAAGTLGGKFSETTELPVSSASPAGTLFNYAAVHIVTTSTLRQLRSAHPGGEMPLQRFRPNIVVDCGEEEGFIENAWPGRTLTIGDSLTLRVSIPCPRCVVTTLPRPDAPLDSGVLRTIREQNRVNLGDFGDLPCVGVYADVVNPGRAALGHAVRFL